ncbi:MAG: hypothetical protein AB202_01090 [Parcubacteria bacterium C7867-007]|nr:MAG: hypothetical protein AB202_01090 [Parcubacteria bacterium C7867-007]
MGFAKMYKTNGRGQFREMVTSLTFRTVDEQLRKPSGPKVGSLRDARLAAIEVQGFRVGGSAVFLNAPGTGYEILEILPSGYMILRDFEGQVSPCRMRRYQR